MKSAFFFCYNKNVSDYLTGKGIKYITVSRDLKTKKIFSLFQINDELQTALNEYKSQSK